jgi:hypothetical protein
MCTVHLTTPQLSAGSFSTMCTVHLTTMQSPARHPEEVRSVCRRNSRKPPLLAAVAEVVGGLPLVPHLALRAVHEDDLRGHTNAAAGGASEGEED